MNCFSISTNAILNEACSQYPFMESIKEDIEKACNTILETHLNGGKILVCGNGGSNSDADHIVGELMKGFMLNRKVTCNHDEDSMDSEVLDKLQDSIPAINLGVHSSLVTAIINDIGSDYIFSQQVWGYGSPGDILIGISTSGNSKNVINAAIVAKTRMMKTIGLTGHNGGKMNEKFDMVIHAPSDQVDFIQDMHTPIYHVICKMVESELWGE